MLGSCSHSQTSSSCFFSLHHHHSQSLQKPTKLQTLNPPQPLVAAASAASFGFLLQLLTCNRTRNATYLLKCLTVSSPSPSSSSTKTRARDSKLPIPTTMEEYLVSNLGVSPESALAITNLHQIQLKSIAKADSVLALFRDYGFTQSQIISIFTKRPVLLSWNPDKTLKPKLEFFSRNGISGDTLTQIVTINPTILQSSLDRKIVPCINFLRTFFPENQGISWLLSAQGGTRLIRKFRDTVPANAGALRSYGVSDSSILKLLLFRSPTLWRDSQEFNEMLREISEMGFDPSNIRFVHGVRALATIKKKKWEAKMEVFKGFGWTDEEVRAVVLKLPSLMCFSEERLKEAVGFFMERLEWTADDIIKYPAALTYSFEGRILPRFSVVQILVAEGLMKKTSIGRAFQCAEDKFLSIFVEKFQEHIPDLLEMYQEKLSEIAI